MKTRIGQTAITCNACREEDASGYEIRLGDPTIHNTMSVSLCRSCYAEAAIVAVLQERKSTARYHEALTELAIDHWNSTGYCRRCQVHAGHSADCSIVVARKALAA